VYYGSAKRLKRKIFPVPTDAEHSEEAIEKYLLAMEELKLIIRYIDNDEQYIWLPDFHEKQVFSQSWYEAPKFPINQAIKDHNTNVRNKKSRRKQEAHVPPPPPKETAFKQIVPPPPDTLTSFISHFETKHKKLTKQYITTDDADKTALQNALDTYGSMKLTRCLDTMYKDYDKKFWTVKDFITFIPELIEMVK
jgi:hypothetical protein